VATASYSTFNLSRWIFLRLIGLSYLAAFWSLSGQILGLIGQDGILPAQRYLQLLTGELADQRFWLVPTLTWINCSDTFLQFLCWAGIGLSVLVLVGICTGPVLVLLWIGYMSIVNVGQDFLAFQWDILLLETGFLSIFLAPWQLVEPPWRLGRYMAPNQAPSIIALWLLRWLLFRLMFESGMCKLASQDPTWANFTALTYHYFTQPLPTPIAWFAQQLPDWFQKMSVAGVFFIEIAVPFAIFLPQPIRRVAALFLLFLQTLIALTGNYAFFNLLTIALCILLLDDQFIGKLLPKKFLAGALTVDQPRWPLLRQGIAIALAVLIGLLSISRFFSQSLLPVSLLSSLEPPEKLYLFNSYGLFAVMTTTRMEIQVEGSNDGKDWHEYAFKFKPQDLSKPPCVVAPGQPRLDWQMWFAALSDWRSNPWFANFMIRLLQGSPSVLSLMAGNPFPNQPPRYVRALLYRYTFTDFAQRNRTGNWWNSEYAGEYFAPASLNPQGRPESPEGYARP
jgi:hypothetical protein